jgi:hypothetical protein
MIADAVRDLFVPTHRPGHSERQSTRQRGDNVIGFCDGREHSEHSA